jgi:HEAT repeat protein
VILLFLFWCLGLQDAPWPELPPKLKENAEIRQKYEDEFQNGSPEQRRAAAQIILPALAEADPAAQADFLLGIVARTEVEGIADVHAALLRLEANWNPFSARIEEVLIAGVNDHSSDAQAIVLHGALRAAGILELSGASRVSAVAAYLGINGFAPDAREALKVITRHEFRNAADFDGWWQENRERPRTVWIASAADQATSEVASLWRDLLASNPAKALDALQHERLEIRMLAIGRLAAVPAKSVDAKGRSISEVVSTALQSEVNPSLRGDLVRLVPRIFPEGEHVVVLQELVRAPLETDAVRMAACETLVRARPVEAATRSLVDLVAGFYSQSAVDRGTLAVRAKLVSSLFQIVNSNPAAADLLRPLEAATPAPSASPGEVTEPYLARLEGALRTALVFETSPELVGSLLRLTGAIGANEDLIALVGGFIIRPQLTTRERQAAIEAYGAIVGRVGITDDYRNTLAQLIQSPDEQVRFAAAGALASTKDPASFVILSERLLNESESEAMRERLLRQLAKSKAIGTVENLLKYTMTKRENEFGLYRSVLEKNINGDVEMRFVAIETMLQRPDWELAWRLDTGLPAFDPAGDVARLALRTTAQVGWALQIAPIPAADDALVVEALARLSAAEAAQPDELEWRKLRAKLLLRISDDVGAFAVLEQVLPMLQTGDELDQLALAALAAAERASLNERAVALAGTLAPMSTPETQEAVKLTVDRLRPSEPIAVGDPKGSPPPETEEGGEAEGGTGGTSAEEAAEIPSVDPPAGEPGTEPEPSGGGGGTVAR